MSKTSNTALFISFIVGFAVAFGVVRKFNSKPKPVTQTKDATILLDRIEKVAKLITVEGYFSEVYKYKDYYKYDIGLLRKEALMRIKAKVSVGYDLTGMDIAIDDTNREVVMTFPDSIQILAIEHDLDYYDISEGTFNSFSEEDYNKLNADAKEFIRQVALESDLGASAGLQLTDMMDIIKTIVQASDYTLKVIPTPKDASKAPTLVN